MSGLIIIYNQQLSSHSFVNNCIGPVFSPVLGLCLKQKMCSQKKHNWSATLCGFHCFILFSLLRWEGWMLHSCVLHPFYCQKQRCQPFTPCTLVDGFRLKLTSGNVCVFLFFYMYVSFHLFRYRI